MAFVISASPALTHAQTVGPQIELAATASAAGQRAPAVSWDTANRVYLMVWEDDRNFIANGVDLYMARIGPDGTLQDTDGAPVLTSEVVGNEVQPDISYNPTSGSHVIVWREESVDRDDQDTRFEIYGTRVFGNETTLTPRPSAGSALGRNTLQSKLLPRVYAGTTSIMVVYQAFDGGVPSIRAVRARPDLLSREPNDPDEPDFEVAQGASEPDVIFLGGAAGGNFGVAYQAGGNLFIREYPGVGSTSSVAPARVVSTATLTQGGIRLAPNGLGSFSAVWEDDRDGGPFLVYGQRFLNNLTPLGTARGLQTSTTARQIFPDIAGDDNGAFVVWQDQRNGTANAIIYATRLDATGSPRDLRGFPILVFNGTAFDQVVIKGPGQDYLIAGVRTGSPNRIFYRVFRDEDPEGTMMYLGPPSVPADGETIADVVFGPATGPADANGNRLQVVDTTLYDVTISSNAPVVLTEDADPDRTGLQVEARGGQVAVRLQSTTREMVDVMVSSVRGTSSGMATIEFLNVAPVASNVVLEPPSPRSDEPLQVTYAYFDVNGDPDTDTEFRWVRDQEIVDTSTLTDPSSIPPTFTRRDQTWLVRVTPGDGLDRGATVISNPVVIGNSVPRILALNLVEDQPDGVVQDGDALDVRYNFRDVDGDAEGPLTELRWFDNGVEQADLFGQTELPGARVVKGQRWQVTIQPHDTFEFGPLATSNALEVVNTDPVADAGENGEVLERRRYTLDGTASSDVDVDRPGLFGYPGDVLTYRWAQQVLGNEPAVELTDTSSPTPSFLAPSVETTTVLTFDLVVNDGTADSVADRTVVRIQAVPDTDGDRLDDEEEEDEGTDPDRADTDRDGITDFVEVREAGTDPRDQDSDDDGVRDGQEGRSTRNGNDEDPLGDIDQDTVINALDPDSDGDGVLDGTELGITNPVADGGTDPFTYEGTDLAAGFFIPDEDDGSVTDPTNPDTDEDSFIDGAEDANGNGRVDSGESDPNDPLDPGTPCTTDDQCTGDLVCVAGVCAEPGTTAPVCTALQDEGLECCATSCSPDRDRVAAECRMDGALEVCPLGAVRCAIGTCSEAPAASDDDGGCACSANEGERNRSPAFILLGLIGLALLRRRRA